MFLGNDVLNPETKLGKTLYGMMSKEPSPLQWRKHTFSHVLQSNVQHGIVKSSTHQEFQTEIVDPLPIREGLPLLCAVPLRDQPVPECKTGGGIRSSLIAVEHAASKCSLNMANDLLLELILGGEAVGSEFLPRFPLRLGDRSYERQD